MRYPAEHKQATRERIVRAAARQFRSRGGEGAGIAGLMRTLRLTHGGFYRHFDSKEELYEEAIGEALRDSGDSALLAAESAPKGHELKALIDAYLSEAHCRDLAGGCPIAALSSELARRPATTRRAFQRAVRGHLERFSQFLPGATAEDRWRRAAVLFSGMSGTLSVARALADDQARGRLLRDARAFFLAAARG